MPDEELLAESLWQEAIYFEERGEKLLAQEKVQACLEKAHSPLLRAKAGEWREDLPEGYEKEILLGDRYQSLAHYRQALALMEEVLSDLYEGRTVISTRALAVYQHRLQMRAVQLKMSRLGEREMLAKVVLHKSWEEVEALVAKGLGKLDESLLCSNEGHTPAQFAHLTEAHEYYLLKEALALRKASFQ